MDFFFFLNSFLFGIGLSIDAFSVSIANGLHEREIKMRTTVLTAGTFAFFQALMPFLGWLLISFIVEKIPMLLSFLPWISFLVLGFLGIKMIVDAIRKKVPDEEYKGLTFVVLLIQGIATSLDAFSVGLTTVEYSLAMVLLSSGIIAAVTFFVCVLGVKLGRFFGMKLSYKADVLGGAILIFIGIEILIRSFF